MDGFSDGLRNCLVNKTSKYDIKCHNNKKILEKQQILIIDMVLPINGPCFW